LANEDIEAKGFRGRYFELVFLIAIYHDISHKKQCLYLLFMSFSAPNAEKWAKEQKWREDR